MFTTWHLPDLLLLPSQPARTPLLLVSVSPFKCLYHLIWRNYKKYIIIWVHSDHPHHLPGPLHLYLAREPSATGLLGARRGSWRSQTFLSADPLFFLLCNECACSCAGPILGAKGVNPEPSATPYPTKDTSALLGGNGENSPSLLQPLLPFFPTEKP